MIWSPPVVLKWLLLWWTPVGHSQFPGRFGINGCQHLSHWTPFRKTDLRFYPKSQSVSLSQANISQHVGCGDTDIHLCPGVKLIRSVGQLETDEQGSIEIPVGNTGDS